MRKASLLIGQFRFAAVIASYCWAVMNKSAFSSTGTTSDTALSAFFTVVVVAFGILSFLSFLFRAHLREKNNAMHRRRDVTAKYAQCRIA
jgi:hypothetical protein